MFLKLFLSLDVIIFQTPQGPHSINHALSLLYLQLFPTPDSFFRLICLIRSPFKTNPQACTPALSHLANTNLSLHTLFTCHLLSKPMLQFFSVPELAVHTSDLTLILYYSQLAYLFAPPTWLNITGGLQQYFSPIAGF